MAEGSPALRVLAVLRDLRHSFGQAMWAQYELKGIGRALPRFTYQHAVGKGWYRTVVSQELL